MSETVALPLWLAIAVAVFALWALYEHVALPALRWLVTHPANQVIDDVSARLRIGIRPFQRTRRQALIHSAAHRSQGAAGGGAVFKGKRRTALGGP